MGARGETGETGETGPPGEKGEPGDPGLPGTDLTRPDCPDGTWLLNNQVCIEPLATREIDDRVPEGFRAERIPDGMTSEQADAHCAFRGGRLCAGDEIVRWSHCAMAHQPGFIGGERPELVVMPCTGEPPPAEMLEGEGLAFARGGFCETAAEYGRDEAAGADEDAAAHLLIGIRSFERPFPRVFIAQRGCGPFVRCCFDR